ncbi:GH3 auxin-responsive promoter family protein OS=Streptomyces tendae OX=1932 GN=GUR47_35270 PE=4 SV=1 [Streptomyces tendae]
MAVRALGAACQDTGAEIRNATCRLAPGRPGRYQVAVAFAGPPVADLAGALDARLAQHCPGYGAGRRSGRIAPVEVITVHEDAFLLEWEHTVRGGQRPPRVKDRVFQPSDEAWARITSTRPQAA